MMHATAQEVALKIQEETLGITRSEYQPGVNRSQYEGSKFVPLYLPSKEFSGESLFSYLTGMLDEPIHFVMEHCFVDFEEVSKKFWNYIKMPEMRISGLDFSVRPNIARGWAMGADCFSDWDDTREDKFGRKWHANTNFDVEGHMPWVRLPDEQGTFMLSHHWHQLLDFAINDEFYRPLILVLEGQED